MQLERKDRQLCATTHLIGCILAGEIWSISKLWVCGTGLPPWPYTNAG